MSRDATEPVRADDIDRLFRDKFRFAACRADGRHSHTWAAWGNKNDYYIANRRIGGAIKTSLHEGGGFRVAFEKKFWQQQSDLGGAPAKRDVVVWPKPPVPEKGVVHVASVLLPTNYFTANAPTGSRGKPIMIFEALPGQAVEVGFFYSLEAPTALESRLAAGGALPWGYTTLDNGYYVSIVARARAFDSSVLPTNRFPLSKAHVFDRGILEPGRNLTNLHAIAWNDPQRGEALQMIEIGGAAISRDYE